MRLFHLVVLAAASAAFFMGAALAQNAGTVTQHAFAIGKGAGTGGYSSLLCPSGQIPMGQSAADPQCVAISGDGAISAAGVLTLSTVNSNVGSFGSATNCPSFTVNGKGLITAASATTCTPAIGSITGLGTGVATGLGVNVGSAGSVVVNGGALGTPSSGVATNLTGTASGLTAGTVTTNANMTGAVTSVGNATTIAANAVTNAKMATMLDGTIKSNISGATAAPSDNTITAVLDKLFGTTQGSITYRNATQWVSLPPGTAGQFLTTQGAAANPNWSSGGAGTGTVTSVTPGGGLVSSTTATCSQTAITASGTLSKAECVNAQTGTSYAIQDSDRAKLITASNAAAQAYTIAQAATSSNFLGGWYTDIQNNSATGGVGIVTITATTSQFNIGGTLSSTLKILPGQSARIISDGTNYQVVFLTPNNDGASKAWVNFTGSTTNGTQTINNSYNVSSVSRTALGQYTITFTTAFSNANYSCVGSANSNVTNLVLSYNNGSTTTTYPALFLQTSASALGDPVNGANVICYGRQ